MKVKAFGAVVADKPLEHIEIDRREPLDNEVEIKIQYCGICHSDIHTARGDWGEIRYPCVTGHEIVGVVSRVGDSVLSHKVGDRVGVGCMVNSCGTCEPCKSGLEQYCDNDCTWTYDSIDPVDGTTTQGGYSSLIVVPEHFVISIPESLSSAEAAPLLCAGITTYSPLRHWGAKEGVRVGIIGLGGLGHMGVKYAKAMGATVTVVTSSPDKVETAKKYGADSVIVSTSDEQMKATSRSLDLLIDTIPNAHDLTPYLDLLGVNGSIVLVGPITNMPGYHSGTVIGGRKSIAGSGIGGIKETQEMLAFSAEHNIVPEIEIITTNEVNSAWDALVDKQMAKRYVIDIEKSFQ
jgi:uncharacterized zinc-type alcohol dehydrogenase-like protein